MTHEKIRLNAAGSAPSAAMYTYFLDLSPEVPVQKRPTVIVCPGGGYAFTSDREAEPIALRLNAAGLNAVVVRYSVAPARFPTALLEVASAVRYVRETGVQYGCDPDRVFLIGFSAGGHLAASYGNFWNRPFVAEALGCDAAQRSPSRHSKEPSCACGPAVITGYESTCPFGRSRAASQPSASATNGRFQKLP